MYTLIALFLFQLLSAHAFSSKSMKFDKATTIEQTSGGYHLHSTGIQRYSRQLLVVNDQRWNREIEESSRINVKSSGMGETLAGAVLGSLVLGPFGKNP
jgi:hypothetical protein